MPRSSPLSLGRLLVALLVALLAGLVVVSLASTRGAGAQEEATQEEAPVKAEVKNKVHSANGKGRIDDTESGTVSRFEFNAKNVERGSDEARGKLFFRNTNGSDSSSAEGRIECLRVAKVDRHKAGYFVLRVTESSGTDAPPVGTPIGINIVDTGKENGKGDRVLGGPVDEPAPCLNPSDEGMQLTKGNITIE
jgi:hypothetical protein